MAAGEILEEEAVIQEEEEEGETQTPHMINSQDNNPQSLKVIDESQKPSCRNGTYIGASIDSLRKC